MLPRTQLSLGWPLSLCVGDSACLPRRGTARLYGPLLLLNSRLPGGAGQAKVSAAYVRAGRAAGAEGCAAPGVPTAARRTAAAARLAPAASTAPGEGGANAGSCPGRIELSSPRTALLAAAPAAGVSVAASLLHACCCIGACGSCTPASSRYASQPPKAGPFPNRQFTWV